MSTLLRRVVATLVAAGLVLVGEIAPANASAPYAEAFGIKITQIKMPDAHHPRLRVFGRATKPNVGALLLRRYSRPGWELDGEYIGGLAVGETFKLKSDKFACNRKQKDERIVALDSGFYLVGDVAAFKVKRRC